MTMNLDTPSANMHTTWEGNELHGDTFVQSVNQSISLV